MLLFLRQGSVRRVVFVFFALQDDPVESLQFGQVSGISAVGSVIFLDGLPDLQDVHLAVKFLSAFI